MAGNNRVDRERQTPLIIIEPAKSKIFSRNFKITLLVLGIISLLALVVAAVGGSAILGGYWPAYLWYGTPYLMLGGAAVPVVLYAAAFCFKLFCCYWNRGKKPESIGEHHSSSPRTSIESESEDKHLPRASSENGILGRRVSVGSQPQPTPTSTHNNTDNEPIRPRRFNIQEGDITVYHDDKFVPYKYSADPTYYVCLVANEPERPKIGIWQIHNPFAQELIKQVDSVEELNDFLNAKDPGIRVLWEGGGIHNRKKSKTNNINSDTKVKNENEEALDDKEVLEALQKAKEEGKNCVFIYKSAQSGNYINYYLVDNDPLTPEEYASFQEAEKIVEDCKEDDILPDDLPVITTLEALRELTPTVAAKAKPKKDDSEKPSPLFDLFEGEIFDHVLKYRRINCIFAFSTDKDYRLIITGKGACSPIFDKDQHIAFERMYDEKRNEYPGHRCITKREEVLELMAEENRLARPEEGEGIHERGNLVDDEGLTEVNLDLFEASFEREYVDTQHGNYIFFYKVNMGQSIMYRYCVKGENSTTSSTAPTFEIAKRWIDLYQKRHSSYQLVTTQEEAKRIAEQHSLD